MSLSRNAQKIIENYLSLPFSGMSGVRCPYFINTRLGKRGALRSLIGKGTPEEIVEEAKITSIQYHHNIFDHSGCCIHATHDDDKKEMVVLIRKFLIDNNLGIDCSGLVTHILRAHFLETKNIDIAKKFVTNIPGNFIRQIIMRLRPVESIGVKSGYYNDKNTEKLGDEKIPYDYNKIQAGDVIIMLGIDSSLSPSARGGARGGGRNHILLITNCDGKTIKYIHSRAWSIEGQYGHGVNTGEINIINPEQGLLEQEWIEKSPSISDDLFHQSKNNETFADAKTAQVLEIRRIKI